MRPASSLVDVVSLLSLSGQVALVAFAVLGAAACHDSPPPVAPVEIAGGDGGLPVATSGALAAGDLPTGNRCRTRLLPDEIQTGSGCELDERVSHGPGILTYPCSGDGTVDAVFGEHRFEGNLTAGSLSLDLVTELDWQDGCHWQTKQNIRGRLDLDEARASKNKLNWTYSEKPMSPSGSGNCYASCRARADIVVEPSRGAASSRPSPEPVPPQPLLAPRRR